MACTTPAVPSPGPLRLATHTLHFCLQTRPRPQVASALAALEACDPPILHRDVKPSNVLIDGAGRARLADFGLSRRRPADGETEGVLTGETGTYLYMSPEIMR